MKIAIIKTNGFLERTEMGPELNDIYKAIGNGCETFQMLYIGDGVLLIDEEAKVKESPPPPNPVATRFCSHMQVGLAHDDEIMGNMVLVGTKGEDFVDISVALLAEAQAFIIENPRA